MNLTILAFKVCLILNPVYCEDRELSYSDMTVIQCNAVSISELAKWSAQHPKWRIKKFNCYSMDGKEIDT